MKTSTFCKLPTVFLIAFLLVLFLPTTMQAQKTFTGTGNFSTAARWSGGTVPVAGDNLIIDGACTVDNNVGTDGIAYGTLTIGTATGHTLSWAASGTNRLNVTNVSAGAGTSTLDMTNGGTMIIRGSLTAARLNFTPGAGTIEMQSGMSLPATYTTYNNLTVNGAGITVNISAITSITGNITISNGTLVLNDATANRASAGGIFTLSGTATLRINGVASLFPANFSTHSISATSTVEYGNISPTVATLNSAQNYGNLTITGGGTKALAGNVNVASDLTINSPSTLSLGNYTLNRSSVGGTLTVANGASLFVAGTGTMPANFSTYAFGATSTAWYNGGVQTVSMLNGASYGNLLINGSTATLIGNVSIAGNLTNQGILDIGSYTINRTSAGGTFSNSGTLKIGGTNIFPTNYTTHIISSGSTVEYYGSNQTIAVLNSAQNYFNLTVSGSGTKTLAGDITAAGVITFNGATITTGANTLYSNSTGSVTRTSGHVVGNFRKYIATGATNKTFEIGDATNYTRAVVNFASVTTAGDLTATVTAVDHASIASSMILPGKTANRNWTLTNSGIVFTTYSATFTFVAGDLDAGAATSSFIVGKYSAGWTYPTVGTKTATSTQATGITAFSDFQLGEISTLPVTYTSIKATPKNAAIQIEWQVGEESSIQKYEIERSADGIHFSKAGEIAAKGNNSSESYQWLDVQPISGNNYYRIRAVEAEGKFFLSKIVVVKMNADKSANVFPNPIKKQQVNIRVAEMEKGKYMLLIHNPQGQQIIYQMLTHPGGLFNQTIYLNKKLPAGMFYLQIANDKEKYGQAISIE